MAQWTLHLSEFDIKLVYIPGKKNIQADSLSQRPDLCPQGTDNKDVVVLPEHLFVNLIDMELQKKIANTKNMDYVLQTLLFFFSSSSTCDCLMSFILLI
jgi:hypothetical protein